MSIRRVVNTDFWTDEKVVELFSPEDKLFMLYLLTNPHTKQLGIYKLVKKQCAFELGYSVDSVSVLLERFENKYQIIKYSNETNEVAIKNFLVHSIVKGGKPVEDCLLKDISEVKDKSLLEYVFKNLYNKENLNETVIKILSNYKENDNDNDNDSIVDESYNESFASQSSKPNALTREKVYITDTSSIEETKPSHTNKVSVDSGKEKEDKILDIYNYWNSLGKPAHTKLTDTFVKAIKKALKTYSSEEIKKAMQNYKTVINDNSYYFDYTWGIDTFLKQSNGLPHFVDSGEKWLNYCKKKGITNKPKVEVKQIKEGLYTY